MTRRGPLLLGIDLGTQSAKVVVHDSTGGVVAQGRRALRPLARPVPGVAEHPDDDLWDATAAACREAVSGLGDARGDIAAVGLCGVRFCRALVGSDGRLSAPVMSWMDERVSRPHDPVREAATVCAASGHLTRRLTGETRDAAGSCRGQWPVDTDRWDWSRDDEVVASYGLRRAQLPTLVAPGAVLGTVTTEAAGATGLPAGVPVVATSNDKAVEALGAGLREPEDVLLSLGTYVAAMVTGERDRPELTASWTNFGSEPGRYLHESHGVRQGMGTVTWLSALVGPSLGAGDGSWEERLEVEAARVPPGAEGLLTVPDWLAPPDEPHRRGAFVGLDARHGAGHLHRSLLEGLAMTMGDHVAAMARELERPLRRVLLTGGGARSAVMRQVVADVTGLPVHVGDATDSAAGRGAAICAGVGTGVFAGFAEAVAAMVPRTAPTSPDPARHETYQRLGGALRGLRAALGPSLREAQGALGEVRP
ncbi:kinase [Marmoricola endophyticus]|uniref:Kinase n=1 Tax=Marmoricola endophyticus TaxID=2040280 RepID=A0A917B950_9ACTN|nr:FGGY-family carbohydrate kinase [Marmoricola endophyticus]GGF30828.1 kinase [Marmoricola endophyticus]